MSIISNIWSLWVDSLSGSVATHSRRVLDLPDAGDGLDVDWGQAVQVIQTDDVELGVDNLKYEHN